MHVGVKQGDKNILDDPFRSQDHTTTLRKKMNFHLTVWVLKLNVSSKCVCFVQLKTASCSGTHPGYWERLCVFFVLSKWFMTSRMRFVWFVLNVFFHNAIYLYETKLRAEGDTQEFPGKGLPRVTVYIGLDGTGLPSPYPAPFQNLLGLHFPFIIYPTPQLLCPQLSGGLKERRMVRTRKES